ncbi:TVP38/TMEM64 family protein [Clostridium tagluense]|nr:TVP38/TMEM64 family protein [Clostridium tagluense]MCB2313087.1 TVP38/TMEM64 family protein [Clostridium tagluense]MCB2317804.1 TVP38/TMEM64 family protein [Clostridium tagluense]MCB2322588.1 TVP38/TMEM64 family protein [Clostridium tagluense]MCB2327636.1 TVP38/TMEM64 family protein [Clostridium tagluense]MCB2332233.1 TVP38/TMEM64 family protein [Clostridium tagluense]
MAIIIAITILLFTKPVKEMIFMLSMINVDAIKGYILSFGVWAPVISFILMILQSVIAPLPAFIITFANAGLFGWVNGALLSWSSAMVGAILCFFIARLLGRDIVEKLTSKFALKSIDDFFERHGKYAILIARLLPFISFDIVSYAAGLTSMSFWSFFIATGIGQLPATIIYSYVGGMLAGGTKMMVFGLLTLFAVSILMLLIKKIYKEKNK